MKNTNRFELNAIWIVILLVILFKQGTFQVDNTPYKLSKRIDELQDKVDSNNNATINTFCEIMPSAFKGHSTQSTPLQN